MTKPRLAFVREQAVRSTTVITRSKVARTGSFVEARAYFCRNRLTAGQSWPAATL